MENLWNVKQINERNVIIVYKTNVGDITGTASLQENGTIKFSFPGDLPNALKIKIARENFKLMTLPFTVRIDYFATGEPSQIWVHRANAANEEAAIEAFRETFFSTKQAAFEYFSQGIEVFFGHRLPNEDTKLQRYTSYHLIHEAT